jgi:hypothetical protein
MDFNAIRNLITDKIKDNKGLLQLSMTDIDNKEFQNIFDLLKVDRITFATDPDSVSKIDPNKNSFTLASIDSTSNSTFLGFNAPGKGGISFKVEQQAETVNFSFSVILTKVQVSDLADHLIKNNYIGPGKLENLSTIIDFTLATVRLRLDGHQQTMDIEEDKKVPQKWDVFSAIGIAIEEIGIGLEYVLNKEFKLYFTTKTQVGNIPMDIQLLAPTGFFDGPDNWMLRIPNRIEVNSLVDDLAGFIAKAGPAAGSFNELFPDEIRKMSFAIDDFTILFHPLQKSLAYISFEINSENSWDIIDKEFTVNDLGMDIYINFAGQKSISIQLNGLVRIGNYDTVNVFARVSTDKSADWELDIEARIGLSGLSYLCSLPIHTTLADINLPEGFLTLKELDVPIFKVVFNPWKKSISDINIAISANMECDLLPGVLSLKNPSLGIDISNPFTKEKAITGSVDAMVDIAKVDFEVHAQKDAAGWSFSGTSVSGDVNIKEIIDNFLPAQYKLPNLFSLTVESLDWNYSQEQFSISTEIDFDLGFGKEKVPVSFVRTSSNGLAQYAFKIDFIIDSDYLFELEVDYSKRDTVLRGLLKSATQKKIALNIDGILAKIDANLKDMDIPLIDEITLNYGEIAIDLTNKMFRVEGQFNDNLNVILVAQKSPAWGFALGVEYAKDINLSSLFGDVNVPDYVVLNDLFIAFSTISQTVNFSVKDKQLPPIQLKKDSLSFGGNIEVKGSAQSFLSGIADIEGDLFINGYIDIPDKILDLKIGIQVKEKTSGIAPKNYPSIPMAGLILELTLLEEDVLLSLAAEMSVSLFNTTVNMDGRVTLEENQFDVSATLTGDPIKIPLLFGLQFEFTDLAFELGDSYELEEPDIGFCGNVTFTNFNAFMALMIDTGEPQNCLFVESMSSCPYLALFDLLIDLCTSYDKSLGFLDALKEIKITGTEVGKIPYTKQIQQELDKGKQCREIAQHLGIGNYFITKGEKGGNQWFITDRDNVKIYTVTKLGNQFDIANEIQLYLVPGETYVIGKKVFPQGMRFHGRIQIFSFSVETDVEVSSNGISFEADCSPLNLRVVNFVSSTDNAKGPKVSLDTIKDPHFYLDGKIDVLGLSESVHASISSSGLSFLINTKLPFFKDSLSVTTNKWESMTLGSSVSLDLDINIPIIKVGSVTVLPPIKASGVKVDASLTTTISIHCETMFSGEITWNNKKVFSLKDTPVTVDDFKNLEQTFVQWIERNAEEVFDIFKKDVNLMLDFVKNKIIDLGNDLANVMRQVYRYTDPTKIAQTIKELFSPEDLARNLANALFPNQQIAQAMYNAGYTDAQQVANIFYHALGITDANVIKSLLVGANFQNVLAALDNLFQCSCFLKIKCPADCPVDCPAHCVADCPLDCPVHCVTDCPAHCVLDCPLHCPVKLCTKVCLHL